MHGNLGLINFYNSFSEQDEKDVGTGWVYHQPGKEHEDKLAKEEGEL